MLLLKCSLKAQKSIRDNLVVFDNNHSLLLPYANMCNNRGSEASCPAALGVEHLSEQVVAGHLTTQVSAVQVILSKGAERT